MKLPSLHFLFSQSMVALRKHPMVILSAAVAVFFAIFLVENESELENVFTYVNLLLSGYLGVPLFIAADIYTDARNRYRLRIWLYFSIILILLMVYFYLPGSDETLNVTVPYIRYAILAIASHLLVSFVPFLNRGTLNGFWHFNRVLFLRFLLSALYSAAFFLGLALALVAVDKLFEIDVKETLYVELFFFMSGVFNTWFFTAGFPKDYDQLDQDQDYPKGLRTFVLYVLIPLLGLYFLILYSYSAKIVIGWNWPSGIMVYMIIVVAVLGTLTMLLAYPYDRQDSGGPIRFLQKGFFWVLIPIIVMLYLAIGIRVAEYGVTINRYITIFLAVWLTGISGYMVLGGKDIRLIPMSLFVIIICCSFGPWGIFQVSERSQVDRLETILQDAGILENGKIINEPTWDKSDTLTLKLDPVAPNEGMLSDSLHNEVMSILDYLEDFHGLSGVESWFEQDPKLIAREMGYAEDFVVVNLMGLRNGYKYGGDLPFDYPTFYAYPKDVDVIEITGFDYLYWLNISVDDATGNGTHNIELPDVQSVEIRIDRNDLTITYPGSDDLKFDLDSLYKSLKEEYMKEEKDMGRIEVDDIMLKVENQQITGGLSVESLTANEKGIVTCIGKLLIGIKE